MALAAQRESARHDPFVARERWRLLELAPWIVAVAAFFAFPDYMGLGTHILIMILFALSLDLVLGYAGIVTLGHAAFFGTGAYAAGLLSAQLGWHEPLTGLVFAAAAAALVGVISGWVLLRTTGLTLLMLTLVTSIMLQEIANEREDITGGDDGLTGITIAPLLGRFEFDLWSHTAYVYALVVLVLMFAIARRIVHSSFGQALRGIRENPRRMHAIGSPVRQQKLAIYTISAAMAGVAGGLFAQTDGFVSLEVLGFARSGDVLIILILGGTGRLYGAFVGTAVFMLVQDQLAKQYPEYWIAGLGLLLVVVVLHARRGLLGVLEDAHTALARRLRR